LPCFTPEEEEEEEEKEKELCGLNLKRFKP